jgi:predicted nucleotidyltransferase
MKEMIKNKIDEYLEFDSDILFKNKYNLVRIFGGAIRDSIANQPINDIDILVGSKALKEIEFFLENKGYHYMEMLNGKDLQEMYSEIHIINEPHTWVKGKKIVQLIRPAKTFTNNAVGTFNDKWYHQGFTELISNVDFSCCGVSYDGDEVYEDYPNAILHCQCKVFSVNKQAKMYSQKRATHRKVKLQTRGWKEIENTLEANRNLKLEQICTK